METINIVCPQCNTLNSIVNEVKKSSHPCRSCNTLLEESTPVDCSDEACKIHIEQNDIPLIIDFYSPDCAPCMKMAPDFEAAAKACALEVRFLKVDTTKHQEVARLYGVNELPTIIAFKGGKEVNRFKSALPKMQLSMWAESLIQMVI